MPVYLTNAKANFKNQHNEYVPINVLMQTTNGESPFMVDTQMSTTSTNPVQNKVITEFVDNMIATNNAHFLGTFNSINDLPTSTQVVTNNDYAWVVTQEEGHSIYNRYKYNDTFREWRFEYSLDNTTFTTSQWNTINSGITEEDVTNIKSALSSVPNMEVLVLEEYMNLSTEEKNNGKFYCVIEEDV